MHPPAPSTAAAHAAPESDPERVWLRDVYRGEAPQLTLRAVTLGGLLGVVLCLSNLYMGLTTGTSMGVAVIACLACSSLHGGLVRLVPRWFGPRLSLLEANAMQTTASAAGYATGSTIASSAAAYLLLTGQHIPGWTLVAWTFCTSALGAFFAIPFKRQLINRERLPFPTGTAAATTLRALHEGEEGARAGARALGAATFLGGLLAILRDGLEVLPQSLRIPGAIRGISLGNLTFSVDVGVPMLGVGALIGLRTATSLLLGAGLCYSVLAPALHASGELPDLGYGGIIRWSLWPGAALLVSASLTQLALQGRALRRGFSGLWRAVWPVRGAAPVDPLAAVELPRRWFWTGLLLLSAATVLLSRAAFGIPPAYGALAVALSFLLCAVACRVNGETDTPGPMPQLTQLVYGTLLPQQLVTSLMTSSLTGNSTAVAADLLSDLKSGHLLGANPRQQFLAQLTGCAIGSLVVVPFFFLLVPGPSTLGGERFPVPAAQVFLGVARTMASGLGTLSPSIRGAVLLAAFAGAALTVVESLLPPRWAGRLPSPLGLGLAFLVPGSMALSLFAGALAASLLARARLGAAESLVLPVASGLIAGESVVAVALAVLAAVGVLR